MGLWAGVVLGRVLVGFSGLTGFACKQGGDCFVIVSDDEAAKLGDG